MDKGQFVRPEQHFEPQYSEEVQRSRRPWSVVVHVLGWLLAAACILGGAFLVFSYGVTFGNDKLYQWVVAEIFAFFGTILITYPVYVSNVMWNRGLEHRTTIFVFLLLQIFLATFVLSVCWKRSPFLEDHADADEKAPTIYWNPDIKPGLTHTLVSFYLEYKI